jgi:hypothetical protein
MCLDLEKYKPMLTDTADTADRADTAHREWLPCLIAIQHFGVKLKAV